MTTYKFLTGGLTVATCFSALTKETPAMKLQAAAILSVFCLSVFSLDIGKGSIGSQAMRPHTCIQLSTKKLDIENLVSYERQDGPVKAIMFIDNRGIKICVSPNRRHAQIAIKKIDQKRAAKGKGQVNKSFISTIRKS